MTKDSRGDDAKKTTEATYPSYPVVGSSPVPVAAAWPPVEPTPPRSDRPSSAASVDDAADIETEDLASLEIDKILARLDVEIPEAHRRMDALLSRLRSTRIAV